ncbi:uncharacterized protein BP01DRAFT_366925 [Aspergillus saccharolyticus JOP 1030-1]|uniref:Uncharacterized protein n=1 Tax=Aspergillus saccharolyticus JOP 1030-1 TaxID=1450539 RepID=A0A318ZUY3_9EURO|nr:hypothetical protein BP01DRAFT_366925 [Aspergillus saccharolyticus JOP 1030-1]PYH43918.1 hypothetical protein BP01DRAFT_366925 [Aspergillus saccharolyticus JOP 1030-1]
MPDLSSLDIRLARVPPVPVEGSGYRKRVGHNFIRIQTQGISTAECPWADYEKRLRQVFEAWREAGLEEPGELYGAIHHGNWCQLYRELREDDDLADQARGIYRFSYPNGVVTFFNGVSFQMQFFDQVQYDPAHRRKLQTLRVSINLDFEE